MLTESIPADGVVSDKRQEFDELFKLLVGKSPYDAEIIDEYLFVPASCNLSGLPPAMSNRILELVGQNGWKNYYEKGKRIGCLLKPPP